MPVSMAWLHDNEHRQVHAHHWLHAESVTDNENAGVGRETEKV